jgi:hypothetical protein
MMNDIESEIMSEAQSYRWSDPDQSIQILERFVSESKHARRAKLLLASLYADDYGEGVLGAEKIYREVLSLDPDNIAGLCGLALLHGRGSSVGPDESLDLLARAATISNDPEFLLNFANKAWDLKKFELAAREFERLHRIARESGRDHLARIAAESLREVKARRMATNISYSQPEIS